MTASSTGNIPLNLNFCRCIRCRKSGQNVEAGEHFKVSHSFKNLKKAGLRIRGIFVRIRILQIRILKTDPDSDLLVLGQKKFKNVT
jgi:hypothetical protein